MQFDREILQATKNNAYVKFEETLRMDRFLDAVDLGKKAQSRIIRNNLRRCRARIATLTRQNVNITLVACGACELMRLKSRVDLSLRRFRQPKSF